MNKIVYKAESRGQANYGWLKANYSFSFASYQDSQRVHFGALRVLNDDTIQAGTGFGEHPHDNMEIITIPLRGALKHKDSMNHEEVIGVNEVQVMSAGTGIFHSEYNASKTEDINLLQIWIFSKDRNVKPVYDQKFFNPEAAENNWQLLVNGFNEPKREALQIHQDAKISRVFLAAGDEINYQLKPSSFGSFVFVIEGDVEIENETLSKRDAMGISGMNEFSIKAKSDAYVLNIEVPDME